MAYRTRREAACMIERVAIAGLDRVKRFGTIAVAVLLAPAASPAVLAAEREAAQTPSAPGRAENRQLPWGVAGDPASVSRTIEIEMLDAMRFRPDAIDVRRGETVRFVVRNTGQLPHEFVIGTKEALDRHAAQMAKTARAEESAARATQQATSRGDTIAQEPPGVDAHDHGAPYLLHVAPGEAGELVWKFNRRGRFDFACLIPGHYEAGMVGSFKVAAR
jgi:uncharacterized cupredoxin-like copper-binding protein